MLDVLHLRALAADDVAQGPVLHLELLVHLLGVSENRTVTFRNGSLEEMSPGPGASELFKGHFSVKISKGSGIRDTQFEMSDSSNSVNI